MARRADETAGLGRIRHDHRLVPLAQTEPTNRQRDVRELAVNALI